MNYKSILSIALFASITTLAQAQTTPAPAPATSPTTTTTATAPDYFYGKWDVLVKGTPQGDAVIPMRIEMKEGKLKGYITNPESKEEIEMSSIEIKDKDLNVAFSMMNYDLTMTLTKKDDDHANGKLMDMFEAEATRKKDEKPKE
jgi:hypothetical protein